MVQRKTPATDGYDAVQLGFMEYAKKTGVTKARGGASLRNPEPKASSFCASFAWKREPTATSRPAIAYW